MGGKQIEKQEQTANTKWLKKHRNNT